MSTVTDYQKQGLDFLTKTGVELKVEFVENGKHFQDDEQTRDIYKVTFSRGRQSYSFRFGQSIANSGFHYNLGRQITQIDRKYLKLDNTKLKSILGISWAMTKGDSIHRPKEPTAYDILCCLTKNDPGTFDDFCSDFGYDSDSRKAKKTYKAVRNEYLEVCRLFSESEREEMAEIQ